MEKTRAEILGENLERIRKSKGYSRKTLADVVGVNAISFSAYERGLREPSLDKIFTLANFLGVAVNELTGDSNAIDDEQFFKKDFFRAMRLANLAGCQLDPTPDGGIALMIVKDLILHGAAIVPTLKIKNDRDFVAIVEYVEETAIRDNQTFDSVLRQFIQDTDRRWQAQHAIQVKVEKPAEEEKETFEEFQQELKQQTEDYQKRLATFVKNGGKIREDLSEEERERIEDHLKRGEELLKGDSKCDVKD